MNKKTLSQIGPLNLLLMAAFIGGIYFAVSAYAVDVDIVADTTDPDCFWADGPNYPGSELYVPNGKTCTITGTAFAKDLTNEFTEYAIIVYPGGTLNIGGDTDHTTLTVDGDILNMGIINIGTGATHGFSSTLRTVNSGELIIIGSDSGGQTVLTNNPGTGSNIIIIDGLTDILENGRLNLYSTSIISTFKHIEVNGRMNVYAGTVAADSINVIDDIDSSSQLNVETGATLNINGYFTQGGYDMSLAVGLSGAAGTATATINGTLNFPTLGGVDIWVIVGSIMSASNGKLVVGPTGAVNINETTSSYAGPGVIDAPSNALWILSDAPNGLEVQGALVSYMHILNQGYINITGTSVYPAQLISANSYKQSSALDIDPEGSFDITGYAEITGNAKIYGELDVSDCTKIANGALESFDIYATGIFGTGDGSCPMGMLSTNDGLFVWGTDTTFTIANGADVDITGDFTTINSADVDANGFFIASGILKVKDGSFVSLSDTDTDFGEYFSVSDVHVEADSTKSTLYIEADSVLDLTNGEVLIGKVGSGNSSGMEVRGTLNIPSISTSKISISENGTLGVTNTGLVQDDATSTQQFEVNDGGRLTCDGTINITYRQFVMNTGSIVGIRDEGLLQSYNNEEPKLTTVFDYNGGDLTIFDGTSGTANGAMKFNGRIEIDITDPAESMIIDGYLEGKELIYYNGQGVNSRIGPSGEMKVLANPGVGTITIRRSLGLYGKLNAADGEGTIYILGDFTPVVGGSGETGMDSYAYILTGDLDLRANASIDVSNFVQSYEDPLVTETYGGSYGGEGDGGGNATYGETKYFTKPYYDPNPGSAIKNPVGMYGFNSDGSVITANGGGGIYIEAKKNLLINGNIKANGQGTAVTQTGSGSGGLIVIDHNIEHSDTTYEFSGSGMIEANGGDGTGTSNSSGGGGGRVIIKSILFDDPDDNGTSPPHYQYTGVVRAYGGVGKDDVGTSYAASGTLVYLGDDNNTNGTLIVTQKGPPASGIETVIQDGGTVVFDRIEAKNGAKIVYNAAPATNPVSCFKVGTGSDVNLLTGTCTPNPDKPDTLFINNSITGAQSGDEPWSGVPGSPVLVGDPTPVFSVVYRNPEVASSIDKLQIQVDDNYDFATPLWDTTIADIRDALGNTIEPGDRSRDVEYAGTTPLSLNTVYYVRARYLNAGTPDKPGLWTHMDMGNQYNFEITDYILIEPQCAGNEFSITNPNSPYGNIATAAGRRFGKGTCTINVASSYSSWLVQFGMASGEGSNQLTAFNDDPGNTGNDIDPIPYTTDCDMTADGTANEEKYGFNITNLTNGTVSTDTETCDGLYYSFDPTEPPLDPNNKYHDVETDTNKETIITGSSTVPGSFDLNLYANMANKTVPSIYTLDMGLVITSLP